MSGYHQHYPPPPSQPDTTTRTPTWYMQPPHPPAAAHPYQHQQSTVATSHNPANHPTALYNNNPAASYYYPFQYHQQQQATASAAQAPPPPPPPLSIAQPPSSRLAHTQRTMQQTGYHSWGFVVYRGAYGDDAAWQRYLEHLKHEVAQAADSSTTAANSGDQQQQQQQQLPSQSLQWTVMDSRNVYENAPLESIRQDFASWVTIEGYIIDKPDNPPRFSHCLYVDQKCLDTLKAFENWIRLDRNGPIQYLACILIDGQVPVDEQAAATGQGYPGWMYANAGSVPELYETLGQMHLWDPGNDVYVMPPRIYPDMRKMK